jgi:hypothetical protein
MLYFIKARIHFNSNSKRLTPFNNGFKPGFGLDEFSQFSGQIILFNKDFLSPDEETEALIIFPTNILFTSNPNIMELFYYEGPNIIGTCKIIDFFQV